MNKPLLSICIPTYNRAAYIGQALDSVLDQLSEFESQLIEVCISDNASFDDTESIVSAKKNSAACNVIYSKSENNLGFDLNVMKVVSMASGDYCWILGSDDIIASGSLRLILQIIMESYFDVYIFPRANFTNVNVLSKPQHWLCERGINKQIYDFSKPNDWSEYLSLSKSLGAGFSYISSMVFNRQKWNDVSIPDDIFGKLYIHAFVLAKVCRSNGKLYYIDYPLICCRLGNDSFAAGGRLKRVQIDFMAFCKFSELLNLNETERVEYLSLLKSEHSYFNVFKHMCHPASFVERVGFSRYIRSFGYSYTILLIMAVTGSACSLVLGRFK